jgi:uncharacterized protein YcbK (DUF882 family)
MFKVLNDIQITRNFKLSEFECHDGNHEVMLDGDALAMLQMLREALGSPIQIAAAYRSPHHNLKVGGSPNSRHMLGTAFDIKVRNRTPKEVGVIAYKIGFRGIGVYTHNGDYFTHVDTRLVQSLWKDQPVKVKAGQIKPVVPVKSFADIPD